jgi:uridine kinase
MSNDQQRDLTIKMKDKEISVPFNSTIQELIKKHCEEDNDGEIIAAHINKRLYGLTTPLRVNYTIEPITRNNRAGQQIYRRSATLMLIEAIKRLYPDKRAIIGQSIRDGYFFHLEQLSEGISKEVINNIQEEMLNMVDEDIPFKVESLHIDDVREMCINAGYEDKVNLLRIHWWPQVRIVTCGSTFDLFHDPYAPSTGYIKTFELTSYWPGMVLRFPPRGEDTITKHLPQLPTLFQTHMETRQWNEMLGVENLGQLNGAVFKGNINSIIKVAEGLHEKKIASIADTIASKPDTRLVIIAGPSSSGKTTFSKRLAIQLRVNGIKPVTLEMDNFFVERDQTPIDENGEFDFESIDAIDIELFNSVLIKLMDGETVDVPIFDFKKGGKIPKDQWVPHKLEKDEILIIEGIHGLNDILTKNVVGHRKFKIYISALTQLCIDDHNRIFTSDTRLIRRIVRDRNFRGYNAAETIMRWPSVQKGEKKHIFPFQEKADIMFNSALVYEPGVLKTICERALLEVDPNHPAFPEAFRLLRFFKLVMPISKTAVPSNSLIREFLGKSSFQY